MQTSAVASWRHPAVAMRDRVLPWAFVGICREAGREDLRMWRGGQDGVEAPPEEERPQGAAPEEQVDLGDSDPALAGEADLSFATMFAGSLGGEQGGEGSSGRGTPALSLGALADAPVPAAVPGLLDGACAPLPPSMGKHPDHPFLERNAVLGLSGGHASAVSIKHYQLRVHNPRRKVTAISVITKQFSRCH